MPTPQPHRKQVRHYDHPGHVHELTFSCFGRLPLLSDDRVKRLLSEGISRATEQHQFGLAAFVFMPEHVHLIVFPLQGATSISSLLRAIKRPVSFRIKQVLEAENNTVLEQLTVQQRPGVMTFRFWQEGPGYDRNLTHPKAAQDAIDYLHKNPVRRGLCERARDWKWSSARLYETGESGDESLPVVVPLPANWLAEGGVQT